MDGAKKPIVLITRVIFYDLFLSCFLFERCLIVPRGEVASIKPNTEVQWLGR